MYMYMTYAKKDFPKIYPGLILKKIKGTYMLFHF